MESNKDLPSVAEATREVLDSKPFIRELMEMDAVNYRGLARSLKEDVRQRTEKESVNLDSIVMAIRRYEEKLSYRESWTDRINRVLEKSELSMKGDIVYYTLPREKKYHEIAMEAYSEVEEKSGERVYILQSDSEIGIVLNEKNSEIVEEKVEEYEFKNLERNLALVVMDSPEEILEADGILSYLTEKIIMNGIGIVDMVATYTETVFLVSDEDATALYEVLRQLISNSGK